MMGQAIFKALEILKPAEGSKNIIIISDGITQLPDETFKVATLGSQLGVKIYAVGWVRRQMISSCKSGRHRQWIYSC